jgi:hypothetical protein
MPFDIAIEGDTEDTYLDETNDLATVDGNRRVEQHVYLNVGQQLEQLLSGRLTGETLTQAEAAIEDGLNNAEDIGDVLSVEIVEYDKEKSLVTVAAKGINGDTQQFGISV